MMGRSHLLLAGACYAALAARPIITPAGPVSAPILGADFLPPGLTAIGLSLCVAALCGLAPDIDKAGSSAARSLGVVTGILSWGIERAFGHRGGFHSLLGVVLGFLVGNALGGLVGISGLGGIVAFGWSVHLLTDAWTVHGIPILWPLTTWHLKLPPWISTGSWMEGVVLLVALTALFLYATQAVWLPALNIG